MTTPANTIAALLYEGSLCAQSWAAGLDALRLATQSDLFHHVRWDWQAQCVAEGLFNALPPAEKVREYEQHLASTDPRIPMIMTLPLGHTLFDHEHFTAREMSRSPIYADWLVPNGLRHSLGIPVFDDGAVREWVCLIRPNDHGHYDDQAQQLLRQLMPDLLRATHLRARLAQTAGQAALGAAALETLPHQALVVVDRRGHIRYLTPGAQQSLGNVQPGLRVHHGRLASTHPDHQAALESLIAAACGHSPRAGMLRLSAPPHRWPVYVLPLRETHPLALQSAEPHALVTWRLPATESRVPQLQALLGISPSEARLALALSAGQSLKEFAQAQGSSWHTVRTHLRNLLGKTHCHSQAALVQRVRSLLP